MKNPPRAKTRGVPFQEELGKYAKQELTSWLVFTSRSGCSKSFKELDGEICGLLKLVNHGNPRKTCLPGETEDTDISNYGRISLT